MRAIWLVLLLGTGCVSSQSNVCSDGTVCPSTATCVTDHDGGSTCASDGQLEACAGQPDDTPCSYGEPPVLGLCFGGVCLPSDLTCRNGLIDVLLEECDDGNALSHDGCDAVCRNETLEWRSTSLALFGHDDGEFAPNDHGAQMVYDARRDRLVLYSGSLRQTWEWDGVGWSQRSTVVAPSPRFSFGMAYDARRGRVVLFGGRGNGTSLLDDTWEWDGTTWEILTPDTPPPPRRAFPNMAYDPARGAVVMFGGNVTSNSGALPEGAYDDLWSWDGTRWLLVEQSAPKPSGRKASTMTYDPRRGVIVMFGGRAADETPLDETWELSTRGWTLRQPIAKPPARAAASAAYDPIAGGIVVHGGDIDRNLLTGTTPPLRDTWLWDGETWQELETDGIGGAGETMAAFPRGGPLMRIDRSGSMLEWDAVDRTWDTTYPHTTVKALLPAGVLGRAYAVDVVGRRLVAFGGSTGTGFSQLTHVWDGARWTFVFPPLPSDRGDAAMVYDEERRLFVLFGGQHNDSFGDDVSLDETWTFDGASWTQLTPATSPPAREGHVMVYDPVRKVTVMFGGVKDDVPDVETTWEWDGTTWTEVPQVAHPPVARDAAAAWDPSRRAVVWHGGSNAETWTYDGTWQRLEAAGPPPRSGAAMVWNAPRKALMLFGGEIGMASPADDVWELDGAGWKFVPVSGPGGRSRHTLFPLFDGTGVGSFGGKVTDLMTTLVARSTSIDETCGRIDVDGDGAVGCDDPDCWPICTPGCPPGTTCGPGPKCGDGTCDAHERCETCPEDCGVCPARCGDGIVDPGEDAITCPGDFCIANPC